MKRPSVVLALVLAAVVVGTARAESGRWESERANANGNGALPCRFAPLFTQNDILNNPNAANAFLDAVFYWEGNFHADGVGLNAASGLTYDGHQLDYTTGETSGLPHQFSAPSKESIHIALLALALNGDQRALTWVLNTDTSPSRGAARAWALTLLTRKIASYEAFNAAYPGFGCFLPWFAVNDTGLVPTWDWTHTVPSLDNGEMIWALYAVATVLAEQGHDALAQRYVTWYNCMTRNARAVFYNATDNGLRTVTSIVDTSAPPTTPGNYFGQPGYLDDPYEGETMTVWLTLFAVPQYFSAEEIDAIWVAKRGKLSVATLNTPAGPISTERGWWMSAHEKWKYLMIPYQSVSINNRVFMNGERARTWASAMAAVPGLYASVTGPVPPSGTANLPYYSACGIQALAYETVSVTDVVTPYGALALFLAEPTVALAWYANTLNATRMQNPYGSTESLNTTSYVPPSGGAVTNDVCPLGTWDSKITSLLAMAGGLAPLNQRAMVRDGVYQAFHDRIDAEWTRVFEGQIVGEDLGFRSPTAAVPDRPEQDFTACPDSSA